jgi:hypothetical protein
MGAEASSCAQNISEGNLLAVSLPAQVKGARTCTIDREALWNSKLATRWSTPNTEWET